MSDTTIYTLYPEVGTDARGRFFDGQFLTAQDFVDEQRYHVDRLRRALDLLTVAGVARGLELTAAGPWLLRLSAGTAIDDRGRLLVVPGVRDNIPVPRDLPNGAADVSLFYAEVEARVQGGTAEEQGTRGATRTREVPALEFHAPGAAPKSAGAVRLGRLRVDANGAITLDPAPALRDGVGLRLPAEPDGGPILRSGGRARPNLLVETGDLSVTGRLALGALDPEARLDVRGLARVDALSIREAGFRVDGDEARFYPVVFRDLDWSAGAAVLEISRADAQADAPNAGALIARFVWHAGDGHGADLLACEIVQTRRFVAAARTLARDRLIAVWLRGNRSYAWRAGQRTELVDARAVAGKTFDGETLAARADVDPAFDRDRVALGATFDQIDLRGPLSVAGDLAYTGRQSRLDTAEQLSATVRAADLLLGHSTRRGSPGRALVDHAGTVRALALNFGGDWPQLTLGGPATGVEGSLSVAGDATLQRAASVGAALTVGGAATVGGPLTVSGAANLAKNLAVAGALTVAGDATLQRNTSVGASLTVGGAATIAGNLNYNGRQSRLDVAEQTGATVRAHDLSLGHSARRGSPGRALVDEGGALTINFGADWQTLNLGGATTHVLGNLRAGGSLTVDGNATIANNEPLLRITRARGQATGGVRMLLELFQDDVAPAAVPEVGVALRFHHNYRYWHRIEARADGLHVRDGGLESNAYRALFAGNVTSNGMAVTTGTAERLRIVRGTVNASGAIEAGAGFSVSRVGVLWKILFETAFAAAPTVVATQQYPDNNNCTDSGSANDNAVIVGVRTNEVFIKTGEGDGDHAWRRFHFIAIGTY